MGEHLAEDNADIVAVGVAHIGSPGAETGSKSAVESDTIGLVRADGEGDVDEGGDVLEAITKGGLVVAVTEIAAGRGLGVDEEVGLAEICRGGNLPSVEMTRDTVGGLLDIARFDVAGEEAGRRDDHRGRRGGWGRKGGGRAEGEETDVG